MSIKPILDRATDIRSECGYTSSPRYRVVARLTDADAKTVGKKVMAAVVDSSVGHAPIEWKFFDRAPRGYHFGPQG